MPLEHMVWLKPKAATSAEALDALLLEMIALREVVPGVVDITAGRNITDRAQGCTHAAIVTLDSPASLEGYLQHPDHQIVGGKLREAAELLVFDYER